jgi:hypothetical protein
MPTMIGSSPPPLAAHAAFIVSGDDDLLSIGS